MFYCVFVALWRAPMTTADDGAALQREQIAQTAEAVISQRAAASRAVAADAVLERSRLLAELERDHEQEALVSVV